MEHLTWLDWYAEYEEKEFWVIARRMGRQKAAKSITEPLSTMVMAMVEQGWPGHLASGDQRASWAFWNALLPFVGHGALPTGRGLKLSTRLIRAFSHTRAPNTTDWEPLAREHGWYFDIPHDAIYWGHEQVRAILTRPDIDGIGVAAVVVLTAPNDNNMTRNIAWMLLRDADNNQPEPDEAQARVNHFIRLSLLYYKSQRELGTLPQHIAPLSESSKLERRHQRRMRSLFVIHPLGVSASMARSEPVEPRGAWQIEHKVDVRGHFRWQACGKNREDHELIWIDEHVRGADFPEKPILSPLKKRHRSQHGQQ